MADTQTTNLLLTNQENGQNSNTWGDIVDANFEQLDDVLGDTLSLSITGGTTTLTDEQELVAIIECSGTLGSNHTIEFSGRGGFWIVKNSTSGNYSLTCKVTGQTGVSISQSGTFLVYCNGTDIYYGNPPESATSEQTVASASTTDILGQTSEFIAISGTTTITSLGTGANKKKFVRFTGALTLTHNATSLILPGGANITTASGDTCIVISDASSNVRVFAYQKASGAPLLFAGTITGNATLSGDLTLSGANTHSGINTFSSTSHLVLPGGTTAQRSGTPALGFIRKNSTTNAIEFYNGTQWIVIKSAYPKGYIYGLWTAHDTDADYDISISSGVARDYADSFDLELTSTLVKRIDASWATGTGNGGLASALTLLAATWYHLFLVTKSDGTVDAGFDTSLTASNLLTDTGGSKYRRIASFQTKTGSATFKKLYQTGNYFWWDDSYNNTDYEDTNVTTTTGFIPVSVPPIKILAHIRVEVIDNSGELNIFHGDQTYVTPGGNSAQARSNRDFLTDGSDISKEMEMWRITDSNGRLKLRASEVNLTASVRTIGWIDERLY